MERAYNPQTGEYVFLVDNQWVKPTQSAKNPQTGESAFLVGGQWQVVPSQAPKAPSKERTWGEAITDPLVSAAGGIGSLIKLPGQLYGLATGDFSPTGALGFGQSVEDYWKAKKSEGLLAREAERKAKIQEAEKQGQLAAAKTAFGETITDPALLTSFLGENIPQLIPGLAAARGVKAATGLAGLGPAAQATAAVGAAKGVGAVQQGADVGAESYTEIYKALIKRGIPPDEAKDKAINLARASGASAAVISILANSLPGGSAIERAMAGVPGKGGRLMGAVKGGLGEGFVSEPAEEVGGKFGANLALREVAPETPLTRGLGEAGGMAAVGGLGMGTLSGALQTPGTTAPPPPAPVPPAERVEPTLGAQPTTAPKPPGYQELFDKYRGMRMSAENADILARQTLAEQAAQRNPNAVMVAKWNESMLRATLEQQLGKPEKPTRTEMPDGTVKILQQNQPLVTAIREELARRGLPEKTEEQVAAENFQKRVVELTQEYIGAGVPPQDAAIRAMEQAQTEAQADETTETTQEGAPSVAAPIEPAVGEGVQVAGEPSAGAPAPGVGEPPAGGVVSTEPDAGRPDAGAAGQPSAITPPAQPPTPNELANLANTWDQRNRRDRAEAWFEGAKSNDAATIGFTDALRNGGEQLPAHGMSKESTLSGAVGNLLNILQNGLDSSRRGGRLDYAPLVTAPGSAQAAVSTTPGGSAYSDGPFVLVARPGQEFEGKLEGLGAILVNEAHPEIVPALRAAVQAIRPDIIVEPYSNAGEVATKLNATPAPITTPAAPVTPPTKRGRKPLAPEQKAASDERRAEQRKQANAAAREVEQLGRALDEALKPLDETQFGDEQSLADAKADKQREKVKAIRDLYDFSRANRNTPGARATELLKNPAITPKERADIEAGYKLRQKNKGKIQPSQIGESAAPAKADSAFRGFTNATQALSHIAKTGSAFQKFLANRLRTSTMGVKFVVVEKDDPTPEGLTKGRAAKAWDRARGLFVRDDATGARTVYVRGESFGADQGVNNVTVLHEILHAATVQKLYLGIKADERGFSQDAQVTKATRELRRVMRAAQDEFLRLNRRGAVPKGVADIYEATDGEVFGDVREFLAYGMSDPDIQNFLNNIEDVPAAETFFSRFVDAIRDFFGIGEDQHTAMTNLVNVTDKLLKAKVAGDLKFLEKTEQKDAQKAEAGAQKVSAERKKKMSAAERKIVRSRTAQEFVDGIGMMTMLKDPKLLLDALGSTAETLKIANLKALLPALQTNIIAEWGEKLGIKGLAETWRGVQDMSAMRNNIMISASEISQDWLKLQPGIVGKLKGKENEITALADVMHYSTDRQIDPTKSTKDPMLNNMWNDLSPQAKKVYEQVRDFYKAQYDLYRALLDKRIAEMNIPGDISDPDTAKGRLMADIKKLYESGSKIEPYFPLMRYGDYWLRVGKGKGSEFYMFESPYQREMFLKHRRREWSAEGKTPDIEKGNSLDGLRNASIQNNDGTLLKQIFETLDEPGATKDLDALKDQIYQLYLTTMPEQSFRKQFIHRKGAAGFSGDALRNFVTSSVNMANQLSRLQYGPKLMQSIKRADGSLEEMPNKDKLEMLVREMQKRVEMDVYPEVTNPFLNTAANIANKSAFLYFMTSVKTAVSQLASLPVFGFPVLASRHNPAAVVKEMSRFMLLFNEFGVTKKNEDGSTSFVAPTVAESRLLTEEEKRAVEEMTERGLAEVTMTYDLMDRKKTPTTKYTGAWQATTNAMGALFHHTERINREVMFLTSFRLSRGEGKSFEDSIEQAVSDTYAALGNFTAQNRPRVMRSPVGRVLLQFKTFPAFVTTYLVRNLYRMTKDMDPAARKEARIQFFGTLGMSFALAGYVGIPGASFAFGVAQSIINAMKDEDDEDPLEKRDLELWFRTVFLPNLFGDFKIGDKKLGEILEAGLLNSLTGYEVSSSLSMNNMWFPDLKESATYAQGMGELIMAFIGPFGSLVGKQFPAAIDDFQAGRTMRGFEKLLPNLFRQPVTAARYAEEGATTTTGAPIRDPEEFTKGQLAMQALGFRTEGLAKIQEMNFKVEALRQKVLQERGKLINRLDTELTQGDETAADNVMEKILEFNSKNPAVRIEADMLNKALLARAKKRMESDRGFRVDDKLYPQLVELLDPSRELLEREAAK